jgi:GNAT superfamily N-acetyltransferase
MAAGVSGRVAIHELAIPDAVGAPGWHDFVIAMGIHFGNEALSYGTDELAFTPAEALPLLLDQENQPTRLFVARDDERMVGVARYEIEPGESPRTAWLMIDVLPGARAAGVGSALSEKLQGIAATDGIRKAIVYAVSPYGPGERLDAPTGFGSVPRDNPEVRFLLAKGYRLEQIARGSRLALPADVAERYQSSVLDSGPDFVLHTWIDTTPREWLDNMAQLRQLMSTEEPTAGLEEPEDVWTVSRLREDEERLASSPRTRLFAAVEHRPSGTLAGFTALSVPSELERTVSQEDTLVRREFRGHRLGVLLKLRNLAQLQQRFPGHPAVITFNAEENRHMLDVNGKLGFVAIGYEGAWRKDLPA